VAYSNYLASVPESDVDLFKIGSLQALAPNAVVSVSHLLAYWVKARPLGTLLGELLDGGLVLCDQLWHPLRMPKYHSPDRVRILSAALAQSWAQAREADNIAETDWFRIGIEKSLRVLQLAAERGNCIVSVLGPPMDQERASRVHIPFGRLNFT